jgi:hypothetical protein
MRPSVDSPTIAPHIVRSARHCDRPCSQAESPGHRHNRRLDVKRQPPWAAQVGDAKSQQIPDAGSDQQPKDGQDRRAKRRASVVGTAGPSAGTRGTKPAGWPPPTRWRPARGGTGARCPRSGSAQRAQLFLFNACAPNNRAADDDRQQRPDGCSKVSAFDRRSNRRLETVTDPETGETLCHQDHPLSEHHGHGSAKQRPNPLQ